MENRSLVSINGFKTFDEYKYFLVHLNELLSSNVLIPIEPKNSPYTIFYGKEERWFTTKYAIVWLLVPPDYPFQGFFKPIKEVR